jgi:hypothetical protein
MFMRGNGFCLIFEDLERIMSDVLAVQRNSKYSWASMRRPNQLATWKRSPETSAKRASFQAMHEKGTSQ